MALGLLGVSGLANEADGRLTIDLRSVDFVLPGGIVALACRLRSARNSGLGITLLPPDGDAGRYASRMGLLDVLADCGVHGVLPEVTHHDRADVLVECRWIDHDAVEGLASFVAERLYAADVDATTVDLLGIAVYEVADNVRTHAQSSGGFICAQTYERGTSRERVELAVGDFGRGITASLSARHAPTSDEAALRLAVTESISGLSERRGLGLHYITRDVPRAGGRATIASGSAYLVANPNGPFSSSCGPVGGTLVGIRVPVGRLREVTA